MNCDGSIDVNGFKGPNIETKCSNSNASYSFNRDDECVIDSSSVKDIYPIVFSNASAQPLTNVGWYLIQNRVDDIGYY